MYLFLIWLFLFVLGVIAFKWILMMTGVRVFVQDMLEHQSEANVKKFFVIYSIIALIFVGGQVIGFAWPPTLEHILGLFKNWYVLLAIAFPAVIILSPLLICFDLWRARKT